MLKFKTYRGAYWVGLNITENGLVKRYLLNLFGIGAYWEKVIPARSEYAYRKDVDLEPFAVQVHDSATLEVLFTALWTTNDAIYKRVLSQGKLYIEVDGEYIDYTVIDNDRWSVESVLGKVDILTLHITVFDSREKVVEPNSRVKVYYDWESFYGDDTEEVGEGDEIIVSHLRDKN